MAEIESVDISEVPALARLVDEARRSRKVVEIRDGDVLVARLNIVDEPPVRPIKVRTPEDHAAFLRAAGSWKDEDIEVFLQDIYESRDAGIKPPVNL